MHGNDCARRQYPAQYQVRPGQVVTFHWRADWRRACQGVITRTFTDAKGVTRPDGTLFVQSPFEMRTYDYPTETVIPMTLATGSGYYQSFGRYWCSPVQQLWPIEVETPRVPFHVVR